MASPFQSRPERYGGKYYDTVWYGGNLASSGWAGGYSMANQKAYNYVIPQYTFGHVLDWAKNGMRGMAGNPGARNQLDDYFAQIMSGKKKSNIPISMAQSSKTSIGLRSEFFWTEGNPWGIDASGNWAEGPEDPWWKLGTSQKEIDDALYNQSQWDDYYAQRGDYAPKEYKKSAAELGAEADIKRRQQAQRGVLGE